MTANLHKPSNSRLVRLFVARRRLMLSVVSGLILMVVLPASLRISTRYLLAWDLTAAIYVGFAFLMMARSTVETCHDRASLYDERDWVIVALVVASAAASFGAIFTELAVIKSAKVTPIGSLCVAAATVVLSWTFTHVIFTLHYANLYYRPDGDGHHGGLKFPGHRAPDYRDFLYYSFVIGCAAQTADVETVSPAMRLASLAHGVIAFAFNTAILALSINVAASLLS
ncbi:MAG TPA: DUF1345 domain-containing protein [Reyranella sp.]|jgi:uncharacterized membrane protein|nr:DUF1345 domain-containing protein [Reyranella sp.]